MYSGQHVSAASPVNQDQCDDFGLLLSSTYRPCTASAEGVTRVYNYFENGRLGIRLPNLKNYKRKRQQWKNEKLLHVGRVGLGEHLRSKMSFRICLEDEDMYSQQKNVLCQSSGKDVAISVGKAAQCAAEVVEKWLQEKLSRSGDAEYDYKSLYLLSLDEIGASLQIQLSYRPYTPQTTALKFRCDIEDLTTRPTSPATNVASPPPTPHVNSVAQEEYGLIPQWQTYGASYTYGPDDGFGLLSGYNPGPVNLQNVQHTPWSSAQLLASVPGQVAYGDSATTQLASYCPLYYYYDTHPH